MLVSEFTAEKRRQLGRTSKVLVFVSAITFLGAIAAVLQIWATIWFLGIPNDSTTILIVGLRMLYAPTLVFIAWSMWKYAGCLKQMSKNGVEGIHATVDWQAKLWLAISFLFMAMLIGAGLMFVFAIPQ